MSSPDRRRAEMDLAWDLHQKGHIRGYGEARLRVELRKRVSSEQNHRCCYCGVRTTDEQGRGDSATLEHILPRRHGGRDDYANVVMACHGCNNSRGDRVMTLPILCYMAIKAAGAA
jgi:5-methylcytosine-specific restriction endonuclease McrA